MRVVIVEDDDWKREQLQAFLCAELPGAKIRTARSVSSGLREILAGAELAILDMSLPSFEREGMPEGRPQGFGGREILKQLELRNCCTPAIVVSQYGQFEDGDKLRSLAEVDAELRGLCPRQYIGSVLFTAAVKGWEDNLRILLGSAITRHE